MHLAHGCSSNSGYGDGGSGSSGGSRVPFPVHCRHLATSCNLCGTVPRPPLEPVGPALSSEITKEGEGVTCPWLREGRGETEENKRPEGAEGQLARKGGRRKLLPGSDSDPPKMWVGIV